MEQVPALPDHLLDLEVTSIARPVFLVGCARSGTSILGEIIAVHPRVTYLYEVSAIWNRVLPGRRDHRLTPADATAEVIERLHQELGARMPDPRRDLLVEKNPKHTLRIGFLDAAFPDSRIIHLIRDGRDTVASLMFRNRGPSWGHLKVPGWAELLARYPEDNHVRCAYQWRDSVAIGRGEGLSLPPERYHEIRFERLVEDPLAAVEEAMAFLQLEMTPEVRAVLPRIQDATQGSYHARRQVRHYVDNHQRRVGRFRENLSPRQVEDVLAICGDLLQELGYL
jgi:hypothetical protein